MSEYTNNFHTLHTKLSIRTLSGTWFWNIAVVYIGTSELRWTFLTSLHLDLLIGMLSKSRRDFNKRKSKNLDLWIHHGSKERETLTRRTQEKERKNSPYHKQIRGMERQRRTMGSGVNFIKFLGTTLMNVAQSSHYWMRSNLQNQILILIPNPMPQPLTMGGKLLMQTTLPLLLPHRFK